MSGQSSSSFTSFSYSSTSSSTNSDGQVSGSRHVEQTYTDPSGTKVMSASQNLGQPIVQDTKSYDAEGRELIAESGTAADNSRRIEDVTDAEQAKRDLEYEERMEEEYAKREGGA